MEWNIPDTDATQLLAVWTDQVKDNEHQYSNKTFVGFRSSCDPGTHDECDLMAAEIQAAAVCQVCGLREQSEEDCWYHTMKRTKERHKNQRR